MFARVFRSPLMLWTGLFLLLGFLVFGQALLYGFVELDDSMLISDNPAVHGISAHNIKTVFTTYDPELYIPLTLVSFQIDYAMGGGSPFLFHLQNILLHALNAFLMSVIAWKLLKRRWAALLCGLLFLVHPIQTEAVVWASARKDVLSGFFFLLSVLLYLIAQERGSKFRWMSIAAFLLGLLAKVSIIPLPFALLLIDLLHHRRIDRRVLIEKLPYFLLAIVFGIVALFGKQHVSDATFLTKLLLWMQSVFFYLGKIILPLKLSVLYPASDPMQSIGSIFAVAGFIAVTLIAFLSLRRTRILFVAWVLYLLMLAPSIFNLAKGPDLFLASDRYVYLSSIGVFLLLSAALVRLSDTYRISQNTITTATMVLIAALTFGTVRQIGFWKDSETLFRHVIASYPSARLAYLGLGNALRDAGKTVEAEQIYTAALAMKRDPQVLYNMGLLAEIQGKPDEAQALYEEAIQKNRGYTLAHINLGKLFYQKGMKDAALEQFRRAAREAPSLAMPLFNMGVIEGEQGKVEEALKQYRSALQNDPSFMDARTNMISLLVANGRTQEAKTEIENGLKLYPHDPTLQAMHQALK